MGGREEATESVEKRKEVVRICCRGVVQQWREEGGEYEAVDRGSGRCRNGCGEGGDDWLEGGVCWVG